MSKVKVSNKMTDPSPIIREVLPLAMKITDWGEGLRNFNWLESIVIWLDAPVSINHLEKYELEVLPWQSATEPPLQLFLLVTYSYDQSTL